MTDSNGNGIKFTVSSDIDTPLSIEWIVANNPIYRFDVDKEKDAPRVVQWITDTLYHESETLKLHNANSDLEFQFHKNKTIQLRNDNGDLLKLQLLATESGEYHLVTSSNYIHLPIFSKDQSIYFTWNTQSIYPLSTDQLYNLLYICTPRCNINYSSDDTLTIASTYNFDMDRYAGNYFSPDLIRSMAAKEGRLKYDISDTPSISMAYIHRGDVYR